MTREEGREPGRRGRPRQFDHEEALEKAMLAFWSGGYAATGTTELMEEMGVARQSAYNAFGGKHDLFLEALRRYGNTRMTGLAGPLDDGEAGLEALRTVLTWWATSGTLPGNAGCLLINTLAEFGSSDPEVAELARAQVEEVRSKVTTGLRRATPVDGSGDASTDRLSLLLVGTAVGLNLLGKVGVPASDIAGALGLLVSRLAPPGDS